MICIQTLVTINRYLYNICLLISPYLVFNMYTTRTTISHYVQTLFSVQLAFAKFLSKIKGNF